MRNNDSAQGALPLGAATHSPVRPPPGYVHAATIPNRGGQQLQQQQQQQQGPVLASQQKRHAEEAKGRKNGFAMFMEDLGRQGVQQEGTGMNNMQYFSSAWRALGPCGQRQYKERANAINQEEGRVASRKKTKRK
eukprot:scaffold47193_cov28-Tisochrysis_lutea.AAC.1